MSNDKEWIGSAFVGLGLAGMALFGALAAASATLGPAAIPIWALAVVLVVVMVRSPIGKAFAQRLGGTDADSSVLAEIDDLRERMAELESQQGRMLELEERVDFTERILARTEPSRVPGGAEAAPGGAP